MHCIVDEFHSYFLIKTMPVEEGKDASLGALTCFLELVRLGKGSPYRINREELSNYCQVECENAEKPYRFIDRNGEKGHISNENQTVLFPQEDSISEEETFLSAASGPFTGNWVITSYQKQLASWAVYHDLDVGRDAVI